MATSAQTVLVAPDSFKGTFSAPQVAGAIGFTLEFPLQRAYRRARAVQLWADAFLTAPSP